MKKSKFTEAQIVFAIKQSDNGVPISEICRKMGISEATFYNWKKKYGGLGVTELRELRQLKDENARLKQMVANLSLEPYQSLFLVPSICCVYHNLLSSSERSNC